MYGHAQRRAVRQRVMTRSAWRRMHHELRAGLRSSRTHARAQALLVELMLHTGTDLTSKFPPPTEGDVLAARCFALAADGSLPLVLRDPRDCCGIKGALRVQLALQWYPLHAETRVPA